MEQKRQADIEEHAENHDPLGVSELSSDTTQNDPALTTMEKVNFVQSNLIKCMSQFLFE